MRRPAGPPATRRSASSIGSPRTSPTEWAGSVGQEEDAAPGGGVAQGQGRGHRARRLADPALAGNQKEANAGRGQGRDHRRLGGAPGRLRERAASVTGAWARGHGSRGPPGPLAGGSRRPGRRPGLPGQPPHQRLQPGCPPRLRAEVGEQAEGPARERLAHRRDGRLLGDPPPSAQGVRPPGRGDAVDHDLRTVDAPPFEAGDAVPGLLHREGLRQHRPTGTPARRGSPEQGQRCPRPPPPAPR